MIFVEIIKGALFFIIGVMLVYHAVDEYRCRQSDDSKSFECFMARGINIQTENAFKIGFGLKK
jgi:hypothetical protein